MSDPDAREQGRLEAEAELSATRTYSKRAAMRILNMGGERIANAVIRLKIDAWKHAAGHRWHLTLKELYRLAIHFGIDSNVVRDRLWREHQ
jgi:hypothetical protein